MKSVKDCGPLGEYVSVVADKVQPLVDELRAERPELEIIFVVIPGGDISGAATCSTTPMPGATAEDAYERAQHIQRVLRNCAESAGRALYQSPGDPDEVLVESLEIAKHSREQYEKWKDGHCGHAKCQVKDGAVAIALGIRVLEHAGAPRETLVQLTQLCKEACRRAHAAIVRRETVAQA